MIDVILPVLDEAAAIPRVVRSLPDGYRAIVVDNGSTDDSAAVAASVGALVVSEPQRGFGSACFAGLVAATADIVAFMDCDGSLDGADLPRIVEPVQSGTADLVLGARIAEQGAWPLHARLGNAFLTRQIHRRTGLKIRDLGPMRAARREALLALAIQDRRFGWPLEMVVRAHAEGWHIAEIDVPYEARVGKSKVTGTVRGTARTIRDMSAVLR
ncbi:MAG: glycosyltransferase family 2 protein [Acidimicrobiia bacterium]|nr:glycosyltransferase family 2 protein [Acidimicrobiia bacterium]